MEIMILGIYLAKSFVITSCYIQGLTKVTYLAWRTVFFTSSNLTLAINSCFYLFPQKVPALRKKAPYFKGKAMVEGQIKDVSLDDYKGKYLVLFFYPYDCEWEIRLV